MAEDEPVGSLEVRPHPLRVHDQPLDEPCKAVEHVVEREEGVGKDDTLGARVGDIALVPERDVLEADQSRGPHDAGESADPLGDDRISLVRHGGGALLPASEGLLHLSHLRAGQMADLGREALERRGAEGERGQELRVAVAGDDLRRGGLGDEPEPLAGDSFDLRVASRVGPDRPGKLSDAHAFERAGDPLPLALELERPAGELRPERDRLRVHAVRATDHDGVAVLLRSARHSLQSAARFPRG